MASVSITNQTLTMTITIDTVDTVIRKDNCKVQAFGDVVRITDYKGSIYEFLYVDCTSPSEANANDLRDAIEEFLNTGGGGGGITSITSTDGSISVDNTDPSAPDLSIGYRSYVALLTQLGTDAPIATVLKNDTGLTWTWQYDTAGQYFATQDTDLLKTAIFIGQTFSNGLCFGTAINFGSSILISTGYLNSLDLSDQILLNTPIEIRIYP